jgi:hypothetical protein
MAGGIFTSFLLELIVYPPLYELWLGRKVEWQTGHPCTEPHYSARSSSNELTETAIRTG